MRVCLLRLCLAPSLACVFDEARLTFLACIRDLLDALDWIDDQLRQLTKELLSQCQPDGWHVSKTLAGFRALVAVKYVCAFRCVCVFRLLLVGVCAGGQLINIESEQSTSQPWERVLMCRRRSAHALTPWPSAKVQPTLAVVPVGWRVGRPPPTHSRLLRPSALRIRLVSWCFRLFAFLWSFSKQIPTFFTACLFE